MVVVLVRYGIGRVLGDNYSAEFVKSAFESRGIQYERATTNPWSLNALSKEAKPKSQLYLELLPRLCSGEIELLDNELLIDQLAGLERRTRSGGRDSIDHGPNQHDDLANVVAGVAYCSKDETVYCGFAGDGQGGTTAQRMIAEFNQRQEQYNVDHEHYSGADEARDELGAFLWRESGGVRGRLPDWF